MKSVKIEIKSWLGKVLFAYECEGNTIAKTVEKAVEESANLRSANLSYANLRGADLRGANLSDANLSYANLRGANLRSADLSDANLSYANLRGANLRGANLRSADLSDANLSDANLSYANLRGANLRGADLSDIKNDFWDVLLRAQNEIEGLKAAVIEGRINGSTYQGDCACLVGTIANIRHREYHHLENLKPDSSRPIERFFLAIRKGDTPESNAASKIVLEWIKEFQGLITTAEK
ncbi:pentapeptide repeat-containing protein [Pontibacter rufus]|uniref:pentapeptide repeat-containing protein n=1 Tax=Pontibacter rufus TaxID=2791028 RepID=UPI001E5D6B51|nr:pentapeptide repeat-containing protein [Pontibacter sp. 172403-2]